MADTMTSGLTYQQRRTFDDLLAVGAARPTTRPGLIDDLRAILEPAAATVEMLPENRLWFGKSQLSTVTRCEGQLLAGASRKWDGTMHLTTAAGIVAHRAIQLAHTHPNRPVGTYVDAAIQSSLAEQKFSAFWAEADLGVQSDLISQATSKTANFLDSWPTLDPVWTPRFEESFQVRIGQLILGCRVDLVLGRPRPDERQTMFIADLKTGALSDHHELEASFYALVATLRFGVAPFRSVVYSLASGDWTSADIPAERLTEHAEMVASAVTAVVELTGGTREPELTGGRWCAWCPQAATCPSVDPEVTIREQTAPVAAPAVAVAAPVRAEPVAVKPAPAAPVVSSEPDPFALD